MSRFLSIVLLLWLGGCATPSSDVAVPRATSVEQVSDSQMSDFQVRPIQEQSHEMSVRDGQKLWEQAQSFSASGQYEKALQPLVQLSLHRARWTDFKITGEGGESPDLFLGNAALALGQYELAQTHFDLVPTNAQQYAGSTLTKMALGQLDDVEVALNAALEINLTDIRLWNALGQFYDQQERWIEAQETYIRALGAGTDRAAAINNMGVSLMLQGRYEGAAEKFEQAVTLRRGDEAFAYNWRLTQALTHNYEAAISGIGPDEAAIFLNDAGVIAMARGNRGLARELFERALNLSPFHMAQAERNLQALLDLP